MSEYLTLKWGSLESWDFEGNEEASKLLDDWASHGVCMSAAMHRDTPEQKELVCKIIDAGNFETVYLDWDGKEVSKEEAKEYVMNYGQ